MDKHLRKAGDGEPGVNGGERENLLVEAVVSRNIRYSVRKDMDIYSTVPIPFATAALGGRFVSRQ